MSTIADLDLALQNAPDGSTTDIDIDGQHLVITRVDLAAALGVNLPLVIAYNAIANPQNNNTLNFRAKPSLSGIILKTLQKGTILGVLDNGATEFADTYAWLHCIAPDASVGYVAQTLTVRQVVMPPTPVVHHFGLSIFFDGRSHVQSFIAAGARLRCAVVISDAGYANDLAQTVQYIIYRHTPDTMPTIPADDTQAEATARQFVRDQFAKDNDLGAVADNVHIQIANEVKFVPGIGAWWLGVAKELTAMGRKAALFAFAVGQPEIAQWQAMTPALTFAKANGCLAVLHCYASPNSQPGQLSPEAERKFWEFRCLDLYASVPESAHPTLIVGELARETTRGKFEGTDNLLSFNVAFDTVLSQQSWFGGDCWWGIGSGGGQWTDADISPALTDPRTIALYADVKKK
jgi:hypothetical protein